MEMRVARLRALTQGIAPLTDLASPVEMRVARLRALTLFLNVLVLFSSWK